MKNLILRGIVVGPVQTNCYFLKNKETEEILIVDPGAEEDRIIYAVDKLGGKPVAVLLTHGHYDHMYAAKEIRDHYKIPIYAAKEEADVLTDPIRNLSGSWQRTPYKVQADILLEDGEVTELAGFSVKMLLTPTYERILLLLD